MSQTKPTLPNDYSIDQKPTMTNSSRNLSVSSFNVLALKEIPKLSSGNQVSWKQGLKVHLKMAGLFAFMEDHQVRPTSSPNSIHFDMRQAAVLLAIGSTIDKANLTTIDSLDNPKLVYDTLISQHGNDNDSTAANTLTKLFSSILS